MVDRRTEDSGNRWHTARRRFDSASEFDGRNGIDDLLSILSHRRRREVLYYLSDHELATAETIATTIATREADSDTDQVADSDTDRVTPEQCSAVFVDLTHNHLPKLHDRGLIEYDRRTDALRWSEPPERLEPLLERCRSLESDYSDNRS